MPEVKKIIYEPYLRGLKANIKNKLTRKNISKSNLLSRILRLIIKIIQKDFLII